MNTKSYKKSLLNFLLSFFLSSVTAQAIADDTDIFDSEKPLYPPNIMFVMDGSSSMNTTVVGTGKSRMQVLQESLTSLINSPDTTDVNIGIMSFGNKFGTDNAYYSQAYGPAYPVSNIDDDVNYDGTLFDTDAESVLKTNTLFTNLSQSYLRPVAASGDTTRAYLQRIVNGWSYGGGTPIVDSLYEAALYMRGGLVDYGNQSPNDVRAAHPSTYTGDHIADGSLNATQVCSGLETCYQGGSNINSNQQCDSTKTITGCTASTYTYTVDSATDTGGCTDNTSSVRCGPNQTFCGVATDPSQCQVIPAETRSGYVCTASTVADCQARISYALSNCTANAELNGFVCDYTIPAYTSCPGTPRWSCPRTETVQQCQQQSCSTVSNSGLTYRSPIKNECQSNAIILLSDGEPTVNFSASKVSQLIGSPFNTLPNGNNCTSVPFPSNRYAWANQENINYYGRCGIELASFLSQTDNSPLMQDGTDSVAGTQAINVYTIGFALQGRAPAQAYLNDLAQAGGGAFFTAENGPELIRALKDAITGATKRARFFSSPTFTVTTGTSLVNGEDVYLPVFKKAFGPRWQGNVRKFKQVNGKLLDANNQAIFDANGKLLASAQDLWSTSAGTDFVTSGGAANKINPSTRNVLTDDGSALVDLTAANVSNTDLGVPSSDVAKLINFAQGKNTDGTPRHTMGDIIHSKPVFVPNMGLDKEGIIFIGTNEGFLHAINAKDGSEAFAYMPKELLGNIKILEANDTSKKHPYGVDSEITVWDLRHDKLAAGDLLTKAPHAKNTVMLYFGLRRGGQAYYALDVTDPANPVLKWKKDNSSTGYSELGYTFSKPKLTYLRYGASKVKKLNPVLVFGGGYIDDNGKLGTIETDSGSTSRGSAVYIVDAFTGKVVWKNEDKLDYAVPGDIRTMDLDRDGSIDRLYFGDTGGTIWRADLNVNLASSNADNGSIKARLKPFAQLGDVSAPATVKRKFFAAPDIAFFRYNGRLVITLAIGSGDRATPLEENSDDRFFVLVDKNPITVPNTAPSAITLSDLGPRKSPTSYGWQYDLTAMTGEKVLSSPLIFNNNVVFSSFGKVSQTVSAKNCSTSTNTKSRTYLMDLMTGKASIDLSRNGGKPKDPEDISVEGRSGVISQTPQIVFTKMKSADPTAQDQSCKKGSCVRAFEIVDGTGVSIANDTTSGALAGAEKTLPRTYWLEKKN